MRNTKIEHVLDEVSQALHIFQNRIGGIMRDISEERTLQTALEKYVELMRAVSISDYSSFGQASSARLISLQHLAGRTGDDLDCAAHCLARRNNQKLRNHTERARNELLLGYSTLQSMVANIESGSHSTAAERRNVSVALLRFFSHMFALASLLDDPQFALKISRFVDAECTRLRHLTQPDKGRMRYVTEDLPEGVSQQNRRAFVTAP